MCVCCRWWPKTSITNELKQSNEDKNMTISTQAQSQECTFINPSFKCTFKKFVLQLKKMKPNNNYKADLDLKSFEQLESKKTLHSFKNLM